MMYAFVPRKTFPVTFRLSFTETKVFLQTVEESLLGQREVQEGSYKTRMLFTCFHPCNYFLLEEDPSTIVFEKDSTVLNKSSKTKNNNNYLKFLIIVLTISVESDWGPTGSSLIKKKIYWHDSIQSWRKTCRYEDISDILKLDTLRITCLSSLLFSVCIFILSVLDRSVLRCYIHTTLTTGKRDMISLIPYTCMCTQYPQLQHTGMIVPVKNPGEWFQLSFLGLLCPSLDQCLESTLQIFQLGSHGCPWDWGPGSIIRRREKDSWADKDNRHYNNQRKKID